MVLKMNKDSYTIFVTIIQIGGNRLNLNQKYKLQDIHVHTTHSYCADPEMKPKTILEEYERMQLDKLAFMDHSAQLYVSNRDYWSGRFIDEPHLILDN